MATLTPLLFSNTTGAVAITASVAPACAGVLIGFTLHLSAAGGAVENLTVMLNRNAGAAYDTLLYSLDMSTVQNAALIFDSPIPFQLGDTIDFAYANTNTRTYGLEVCWRKVV